MPSGAFCDKEDVLEEVWYFPSSSDIDNDSDIRVFVMSESESMFC